jgi:phosphoribosylformylglycinamidine synthase
MEMAHACRLAGSDITDIVHISDILSGDKKITDYHFLNLPGGFLDGDNLGAAQAGAHRFKHAIIKEAGQPLIRQLIEFVNNGGLILGICNGFQLMVKTGLLPAFDQNYKQRLVSLTYNDSGRFEDRWIMCRAEQSSPCIFTKGIDKIELPVRHGEGKFVTIDADVLKRLRDNNHIALRYVDPYTGEPTQKYPMNPNGSEEAIAGICDSTGRLMGLMPHPEAFLHKTNHPQWRRKQDMPEEGAGLIFFRNAVEYIRNNF